MEQVPLPVLVDGSQQSDDDEEEGAGGAGGRQCRAGVWVDRQISHWQLTMLHHCRALRMLHLNEIHCLSAAEGMEMDGEEGGGAGPSSTQKQRKGERGQAWCWRGGWRFAANRLQSRWTRNAHTCCDSGACRLAPCLQCAWTFRGWTLRPSCATAKTERPG